MIGANNLLDPATGTNNPVTDTNKANIQAKVDNKEDNHNLTTTHDKNHTKPNVDVENPALLVLIIPQATIPAWAKTHLYLKLKVSVVFEFIFHFNQYTAN
jgi:hypothetical protein